MSIRYISPAVRMFATGGHVPVYNDCYHLTNEEKDEHVETRLIVRDHPWYYVFVEKDLEEFPRLFWINNNDMKVKVLGYLHEYRLYEKGKKS